MKQGSLKLRLILAAVGSILVALVLIGILLVRIFEVHVRDRMIADLGHQLDQLAALAVPAADSTLKIEGEMSDPRFDQPLGGLYWQIDGDGQTLLRSRSLWDSILSLPPPALTEGNPNIAETDGPGGTKVLTALRLVKLKPLQDGAVERTFRLIVATDLAELAAGRYGLIKTLSAGLFVAFVFLFLASWFQVKFGLMPLEVIRRDLAEVRTTKQSGELKDEDFPVEVLPLVAEINRFLALQREAVGRARWRAGDLAHGLKTPLAALASLADDQERSGNSAVSTALKRNIEAMRRHIERHLALARSQGGQASLASVLHHAGVPVRATIEILQKLPSKRALVWSVEGDLDASVNMEREDFEEVIGNLLDNARKWARSTVIVRLTSTTEGFCLSVCDDGPGIADEHASAVLQRGMRLDERVPGSGLGLSIVQAILETYASELHFKRSASGGLDAHFLVPATRPVDDATIRTDQSPPHPDPLLSTAQRAPFPEKRG